MLMIPSSLAADIAPVALRTGNVTQNILIFLKEEKIVSQESVSELERN